MNSWETGHRVSPLAAYSTRESSSEIVRIGFVKEGSYRNLSTSQLEKIYIIFLRVHFAWNKNIYVNLTSDSRLWYKSRRKIHSQSWSLLLSSAFQGSRSTRLYPKETQPQAWFHNYFYFYYHDPKSKCIRYKYVPKYATITIETVWESVQLAREAADSSYEGWKGRESNARVLTLRGVKIVVDRGLRFGRWRPTIFSDLRGRDAFCGGVAREGACAFISCGSTVLSTVSAPRWVSRRESRSVAFEFSSARLPLPDCCWVRLDKTKGCYVWRRIWNLIHTKATIIGVITSFV